MCVLRLLVPFHANFKLIMYSRVCAYICTCLLRPNTLAVSTPTLYPLLVLSECLPTIYHFKIKFQIQMMQQQQQGVAQPTVGELIAQPERRQGRKAAAQAMQVI